MNKERAHIAIVSSPGMGHLIPLAEFAMLLVSRFNFLVTLLLPTMVHEPTEAQLSFLNALPSTISHTFLPPVGPTHLPPDGSALEVTISLVLVHSLPTIHAKLCSLTQRGRVVALVTDLFGTDLFDMAKKLGIPPYMYFTCSATCLLVSFQLPRLHETVSCEYRDMGDPIVLPGCLALHGRNFEDAVQDRKSEAYIWTLHHFKQYKLAEGIFVNSFFDLEPGALRALEIKDFNGPPVYPIGPITRSDLGEGLEYCLSWLDQQPYESVLFVSFGSGGTLSKEQLNELAIGLEKSGHRFLWVVRSPNDKSSYGSFFTSQSQEDPFSSLPIGFIDRIKDRGLLVPSWAPQIKILSHRSTRGFLTHCGWNSILESVICGVPLIAWPLYAEQRMNAVMLHQWLKVALKPNANKCGLVEALEISNTIKCLMESEEGKRIWNLMKELSDLANRAIDEKGESTKALNQVVLEWSRSINAN